MHIDQQWVTFFYHRNLAPLIKEKNAFLVQEKGLTAFKELLVAHFKDIKEPFPHSFTFFRVVNWTCIHAKNPDVETDIDIFKRFVATIVAREPESFDSVGLEIINDPESLRWVVTGDDNSSISDSGISKRWDRFIGTISEAALVCQTLIIDQSTQ